MDWWRRLRARRWCSRCTGCLLCLSADAAEIGVGLALGATSRDVKCQPEPLRTYAAMALGVLLFAVAMKAIQDGPTNETTELVSLNFASWNQLDSWLRQVEALNCVA